MDQVFSSQRFATSIYDAWSQCIFTPGKTRHSFCLLVLPLFVYVLFFLSGTFTNTHQQTRAQFPRDTSRPAVLKSLFHLISSNSLGQGLDREQVIKQKYALIKWEGKCCSYSSERIWFFLPPNNHDKQCAIHFYSPGSLSWSDTEHLYVVKCIFLNEATNRLFYI